MHISQHLILFTRYPCPGQTKTRLIPALGPEGAALLQKRLTEAIMNEANLLSRAEGIPLSICYSGCNAKNITKWLNPQHYFAQEGEDLGERMYNAFHHVFSTGTTAAVLIGSDIPDITRELLKQAFSLLETKQLVLGPSLDGGYYLVGLTADLAPLLLPLLFADMSWSNPEVFKTTMARVRDHNIQVATLPVLQDIDTPGQLDLAREKGFL